MQIIRRIVVVFSSVVGSILGLLIVGFTNIAFQLHLSLSEGLLYGIGGGIAVGLVGGTLLTYYLVRKAKQFMFRKLGGMFSGSSFLNRHNLR